MWLNAKVNGFKIPANGVSWIFVFNIILENNFNRPKQSKRCWKNVPTKISTTWYPFYSLQIDFSGIAQLHFNAREGDVGWSLNRAIYRTCFVWREKGSNHTKESIKQKNISDFCIPGQSAVEQVTISMAGILEQFRPPFKGAILISGQSSISTGNTVL